MEAFVIDDEELGVDYSGLCLRRATAISTRACHVGHGLRLVSAVGMLYAEQKSLSAREHSSLVQATLSARGQRVGLAVQRLCGPAGRCGPPSGPPLPPPATPVQAVRHRATPDAGALQRVWPPRAAGTPTRPARGGRWRGRRRLRGGALVRSRCRNAVCISYPLRPHSALSRALWPKGA
jgi:hypothetical protein